MHQQFRQGPNSSYTFSQRWVQGPPSDFPVCVCVCVCVRERERERERERQGLGRRQRESKV